MPEVRKWKNCSAREKNEKKINRKEKKKELQDNEKRKKKLEKKRVGGRTEPSFGFIKPAWDRWVFGYGVVIHEYPPRATLAGVALSPRDAIV